MPLLNQYRQQYPDVDLDFASGFEANPHELLQTGEFDLLITADPIALKGVEYFRFLSMNRVWFYPIPTLWFVPKTLPCKNLQKKPW
jgi:DNA-binding transcriptional LysR family regulator